MATVELLWRPTARLPDAVVDVLARTARRRRGSMRSLGAPSFKRRMRQLIFLIPLCVRCPYTWHQASAIKPSKGNEKEWCDGEQIIMVMCCLGRSFLRGRMRPWWLLPRVPWTYGGLAKRRRGGAIAVQQIGSSRLKRAKLLHTTKHHDATNAFFSINLGNALVASADLVEPVCVPPLNERIQTGSSILSGTDSSAHMVANGGISPGDHAGTNYFVWAYAKELDGMGEQRGNLVWTQEALRTTLPGYDEEYDLATTGFVDDVASKIMHSTCRIWR